MANRDKETSVCYDAQGRPITAIFPQIAQPPSNNGSIESLLDEPTSQEHPEDEVVADPLALTVSQPVAPVAQVFIPRNENTEDLYEEFSQTDMFSQDSQPLVSQMIDPDGTDRLSLTPPPKTPTTVRDLPLRSRSVSPESVSLLAEALQARRASVLSGLGT